MSESVNNNVTNYEVDGKIHTGNDDIINNDRPFPNGIFKLSDSSTTADIGTYKGPYKKFLVLKSDGKRIYEIPLEDIDIQSKSLLPRIEALKLATEVALRINHFNHRYEGGPDSPEFMNDLNLIYKIADHNLRYIMGEK